MQALMNCSYSKFVAPKRSIDWFEVRRKVAHSQQLSCAVVGVICAAMVLSACSRLDTGATADKDFTMRVLKRHVLLVPMVQSGYAGWCLTVLPKPVKCAAPPTYSGPIFTQHWVVNGRAAVGVAITQANVFTLGIGNSGYRIPTEADPDLPDRLRSAVVELRLTKTGSSGIVANRRFVALGARDEAAPGSESPTGALSVETQPFYTKRNHAATCALSAPKIAGLEGEDDVVRTPVRAYRYLSAGGFESCASTGYVIPGVRYYPLFVGALLNAMKPGGPAPALAAMTPLRGHPGVFLAPTGEGLGVAKRFAAGWVIVAFGHPGAPDPYIRDQLRVLQAIHAAYRP